ncbi:MAG TPA: DUF1572 family protein [Bacteroidia bacterium]|nr:DUF1572 family protein [Bacteroidia bacterium]
MLHDDLYAFFEKDLLKLKEEIALYEDEKLIWAVKPGIGNPAGNLCLHLNGNLQHFIGAILGQTGYIRQRELEFSQKNIPRQELLNSIDQTIQVVRDTLSKLSAADFEKAYPLEVLGKTWKTGQFLLHLLSHLSYHLGQVNYHRRMIV